MAQQSQEHHGPSSTLKYVFYIAAPRRGCGKAFVSRESEPHHLLGADFKRTLSLVARSHGGRGTRWQAHDLRRGRSSD